MAVFFSGPSMRFASCLLFLVGVVCVLGGAEAKVAVEAHDECVKVPMHLNKTCYKEVEKQVPYECGSTSHNCRTEPVVIPSTCTRPVMKQEEYSCPKTVFEESCENVPVTKHDVCYKEEMKKEAYTCVKQEMEKVCKLINLEVPSTCTKEVMEQEGYDCSYEKCEERQMDCSHTETKAVPCKKTEYKQVCEQQQGCVPHYVDEAYDCSYTDYENTCREGAAPVPGKRGGRSRVPRKRNPKTIGMGGMKGGRTMRQKAPGKNTQRTGRFLKQVDMLRTGGHDLLSRTGGHDLVSHHGGLMSGWNHAEKPAMRGIWGAGMKGGAKGSMRGGAKREVECNQVPIVRQKTCYRKVQKTECKSQGVTCRSVPMEVESTCYKTVPGVCEKAAPHCTTVPRTCYRSAPRQESYSCMKKQPSKKCSLTPVQRKDTCYKEVPVKRSYDCSKTMYEEKCQKVPKVTHKKCHRQVESVEKYDCSKTEYKKCDEQAIAKTCYRSERVKEAYECGTTEYRTECHKTGHVVESAVKVPMYGAASRGGLNEHMARKQEMTRSNMNRRSHGTSGRRGGKRDKNSHPMMSGLHGQSHLGGSHALGGHALGGHLGGHALGGHALSGHALGGHALGGHMDRLGHGMSGSRVHGLGHGLTGLHGKVEEHEVIDYEHHPDLAVPKGLVTYTETPVTVDVEKDARRKRRNSRK